MSLSPGTKLAHYEILEPIGKGGMGEVYRATDSKLGRDVAIKVLPTGLADNEERLARFEREARLLAAVNHPHIATLHGLEESDGARFLVMELVEGETLAERIGKKGIPVAEALPLFQQIAEALECAHEQGVLHRDLKPANVKVTSRGQVKVLDFGLAKAFGPQFSGDARPESPTVTREGTETGVVLGTAAYMSPEQARGQSLDRRTDIWSFGCVFYEALTGVPPFLGATVSDTIARILEREPEWEALPKDTPAIVRALLRRCLRKDAERRLHDIADARIEIEDALGEPAPEAGVPRPETNALPWVVAGLAVALAGAALWAPWRGSAPGVTHLVRTSLEVPSEHRVIVGEGVTPTISPDGTRLVYRSRGHDQLYLRELDRDEATPIPGTEGAGSPFFSPDGQWLGFRAGGELKKVRLDGSGPGPLIVAEQRVRGSASWGPDDTIVFATASGLMRVPASGGAAEVLTTIERDRGELRHYWPDVLPNGKGVLFTLVTGHDYDESDIVAYSFQTGERHYLLKASFARYAPTGHLIYARKNTLHAVPFDAERMEVRGTGIPVQSEVWVISDGPGVAHFSLASDGTLVYLAPPRPARRLLLVDLDGRAEPLPAPALDYWTARFSPDGRRLALTVNVPGASYDIYGYELEPERMSLVASTFEGPSGKTFKPSRALAWSPDGSRLAVNATAPGEMRTLFTLAADGSGRVDRLTEGEGGQYPDVWSKEGKLLFTAGGGIFELDLETRVVRMLVKRPGAQAHPALSPDGRWLAYVSTESGRPEVYIAAYPEMEGRRQVSTHGGGAPVWSPDGRRLYYREWSRVMAVAIQTGAEFSAGAPERLFDDPYHFSSVSSRSYDIAPDGERFVMIESQDEGRSQFQLVLNWLDEVERLVPN